MEKFIGKNVLFKVNLPHCDGVVQEGVVAQISPSGNCVKVGKQWFETAKVGVLEELPKAEAKKKGAKK